MRKIYKLLKRVARPEGFEPPTLCLEGSQLFLDSNLTVFARAAKRKSLGDKVNTEAFLLTIGKRATVTHPDTKALA